MPRKIDISHKTIFFITAFILGLWMLYLIRDLLLILFFALILTSALSPLVNFFVSRKLPKPLSIVIAYIIILGGLTAILASFLPQVAEQTAKLIVTLPPLLKEKFNLSFIEPSLLQSEFPALSRNIFSVTLTIFDNIVTIIFLLVLTFYLLLEKEQLEHRASTLFIGREEKVKNSLIKIEDKLGSWVRGQLVLSLIVGLLAYIGLIALDVPYALPLAFLAGVLEVVPVIGPIISAIPAIALALTISPILAAGVAAMFFVIQQLENSLIVPQVMKRAVGLNPLIVILAVAIGSRLLGIAGALLAVPIAVVAQIIIAEILEERKP